MGGDEPDDPKRMMLRLPDLLAKAVGWLAIRRAGKAASIVREIVAEYCYEHVPWYREEMDRLAEGQRPDPTSSK